MDRLVKILDTAEWFCLGGATGLLLIDERHTLYYSFLGAFWLFLFIEILIGTRSEKHGP